MTPSPGTNSETRRALGLAGLVVLQALCAAFFLADVLGDLGQHRDAPTSLAHNVLEFGVVLALIAGVAFGALETRRVLQRQSRIETGLRVASGAFAEVLDEFFTRWALTPAERDVALMAIKGLGVSEMAAVRGTADGTIKAQCAAIYSKAGVSGRTQLLSLFIEELLADDLMPSRGPEQSRARAG
jgi:DNA-binding CsgD family transcriptional regulator